ncbi:MAG: HAD hydrolase-like protein [bacterium]|nr:HAD hydrolase-like protein [bacterium]
MEPFFKGPFRKCALGEADVRDVILPFLEGWNWKGTVDGLLAYWFAIDSSIDDRLIKHVRELRAKNIRCLIATDNDRRRTEYLWNTLGLLSEFDGIFSSSHLGCVKGDQEFWQSVWPTLREKEKSSVLFWDDDPKNVEAARRFGFSAELYTDFDSYRIKMTKLLG